MASNAATCTACELYHDATQTVFGAGPIDASLVLVGEQPGEVEDREGKPFVGPAGKVLRDALEQAEIDIDDVYLTNAVKHFRWEARGERRIHRTPGVEHVRACHRWVDAEIEIVDPSLVVLLGAVAAKSLAPELRVMRDRGVVHESVPIDHRVSVPIMVTIHPSAVLRADDRDEAMAQFVSDLRVARAWIGPPAPIDLRGTASPAQGMDRPKTG